MEHDPAERYSILRCLKNTFAVFSLTQFEFQISRTVAHSRGRGSVKLISRHRVYWSSARNMDAIRRRILIEGLLLIDAFEESGFLERCPPLRGRLSWKRMPTTNHHLPDMNETTIQRIIEEWIQEPESVKTARLTVMAALAICGVLGNIIVFVVLLKRKPFRGTLRYFIFHLALSDTGVLLVNYPLAVTMEQHLPAWTLGEAMCFIAPCTDTFLGVAILSIVAIAIDRHKCVALYEVPLGKLAVFKKHGLKMILVAIWFVAFMSYAFPWLLVKRYESLTLNGTSQISLCTATWPDSIHEGKRVPSTTAKAYSAFLMAGFYILPILLISFTYWKIARDIRRINVSLTQSHCHRSRGLQNRLAVNTKAKKILTPLVLVFATTMFSLNVFRVLMYFHPEIFFKDCYLVLYNVCVFTTVVNSALDPIIYAVYSREFRRECRMMLPSLLPARVNEAMEMKRRDRRVHPARGPERPVP